jgi:hypothetical protein
VKTTTARLLKLKSLGHVIEISAPPYAGRAVTYAPRSKYDPKPWTLDMFRFSAGELHAEAPNTPLSAANAERANKDLADVVFEGDGLPAVYVAAGASLAATLRRLRAEDDAANKLPDVTCPDGVVRAVSGILTVPGEPDRYETTAGAWRVSECTPKP